MIVVAKLKAKSGEEQKMEEALRGLVAKVEAEEGTLVYTLHRSQKDPTQFLFYEKYTDAEALKAHSETSYFKETFGVLQNLVDGAPEIEFYDEVAGLNK
jgi:quinol monooxygenase YgiN